MLTFVADDYNTSLLLQFIYVPAFQISPAIPNYIHLYSVYLLGHFEFVQRKEKASYINRFRFKKWYQLP